MTEDGRDGERPHIAVLMTCHNRRAKTLQALASLRRQTALPHQAELSVHLVDAASSDGTAQAVAERFPEVTLVPAAHDVFWGTGMRMASRSSGLGWSHQLWLNDDVALADDALATLLVTARDVGPEAIVIGAVHDTAGVATTYSGRRRQGPSRWHPRGYVFDLVEPAGRPEPCDTYHGNVVLIPRPAWERTGDIDPAFRQAMGDYDHGFRAARAGVRAYVAGRHVGVCDENPPHTGSREPGIGVRVALRRLTSQRELPVGAWWRYCVRHLWPWAPLLMVSPYAKAALRAATDRWRR